MKANKKVFVVATKFFLRQESFGGLLFTPITGELVQLNKLAFYLLERLTRYGSITARTKDLSFWKELQKKDLVKEVS